MQKYFLIATCLFPLVLPAQQIRMEFPHLRGKTFEFIVFQGDRPVVMQDTVPADGKFTLAVPEEYRPYTGMSRWLITNTMEGGGLDMVIPGKDFSVTCTDPQPSDNSIVYTNNPEPNNLNRFYAEQQGILQKYFALEQVIKAYPKTDKAYAFFSKESAAQLKEHEAFKKRISKEAPYVSQFMAIVNITMGISPRLATDEKDKASNTAAYIANQLDWEVLYTSGHWGGVIKAWVDIHMQVLKDPAKMEADFKTITQKLRPELQRDFREKVGRQ